MAGFKTEKKNPGSKDQQFTKQKNLISPRGSVPGSKGSAGKDEQFNKGGSYNDDDGSAPATGGGGMADKQFNKGKSYNSDDGSAQSGAGSAGVKDRQFTGKSGDNESNSKLSNKSSGGTPGKFDGQNLSPAASIMRAVAKASMKNPPGADQSYQGSKKVSPAKSSNQTKSYKDSASGDSTGRAKSQITQKVKKA